MAELLPSASVEQLQQIRREQRHHLEDLPERRKLTKLATCRHCDVSGCRCTGWTSQDCEVESHTTVSSESSTTNSCKTCHHELEDHGCSELEGFSAQSIFGLVCLCQDVVALYSSVQNQTDADSKQIYFYIYKQLRRHLDTLTMPQQPLFKPSPPFEPVPCISRLLSQFIHFHQNEIPLTESSQLAALFLDVFDVWQLPYPTQLGNKLSSKDLKDYVLDCLGNDSLAEVASYYRTFYSQWLCHCRVPAISARLTLPCWRATAVFGQKLLRSIFPVFREDLIAHFKAEKSHKDLVAKLVKFLNLMQSDFRICDPKEDWFATNYDLGSFAPKFLFSPALIDQGVQVEEIPTKSPSPSRKRRASSLGGLAGSSKHSKVHEDSSNSRIPGDVSSKVVAELLKQNPLNQIMTNTAHPHHHPHHPMGAHHLAVALRDERAKIDYQSGVISVHVVNNSPIIKTQQTADDHELSMFLLAAQNIFTAQLPKMPRPYVARLVFDPKHRTLCLVKRVDPTTPVPQSGGSVSANAITRRVIGAICFCAFPQQKFSEVVFCAVSAEEQVRGFGTFMMSCLKEWHVERGFTHLLTYADEFAVGYFLKQGYSAELSLPNSHYEGFIKEYEGATLMACELQPKVPYTHLTSGIRQVRKIIEALAERRRQEVAVRRPGLSCFDDGVRQIPVDSIPGVVECGWEKLQANEESNDVEPEWGDDADELHSTLRQIVSQVKGHASSWPFLKPVDKSEAPDYYDVIKWPMDLKTIGDRLKQRYYHHRLLFIADFARMFENCRKYNDPSTEYYKCATALEKFYNQKMRESNLLKA